MKLLLKAAMLLLAAGVSLALLLTDPVPLVNARPAPDPEEVGSARDAVMQLQSTGTVTGEPKLLHLDARHLEGLSALASHGFRPDRLKVFTSGSILHVEASRPLPLGRWLNVTAETSGSADGFPKLRMTIGSLSLSPFFSRLVVDRILSDMGPTDIDIPPLDDLFRTVVIQEDRVSLSISWPDGAGLLGEILQARNSIDPELSARIYCELSERQRVEPETNLAVQIRRAFSFELAVDSTPESNGAAFVAIAMAIVDRKVGSLVGVDAAAIEACPMPASPITLHGREDLAKHWALSAAISVWSGTQVAEAMGEWKELADSLTRQSEFQFGDPTGFSLIDIAADRSGFRTAEAASDPTIAAKMAERLSKAKAAAILPRSLLSLEDGPDVDFAEKYGGLDDPRFAEVVRDIDAVLEQQGLHAP